MTQMTAKPCKCDPCTKKCPQCLGRGFYFPYSQLHTHRTHEKMAYDYLETMGPPVKWKPLRDKLKHVGDIECGY